MKNANVYITTVFQSVSKFAITYIYFTLSLSKFDTTVVKRYIRTYGPMVTTLINVLEQKMSVHLK